MEVKVIIFSALMFISKCASVAVDPRDITNQKHPNHQVHYARPPVENKWSLPQYKFPNNINNKHVYKQNNSPTNSPFQKVQNHRQLPVREVIQLNPNIEIQQKNTMSNHFLMNGSNESNPQIKRKPQLPIVKQGISATQVLADQNRPYGTNSPSTLDHDIINRKLIGTKILKEHQAVPGMTDVTNVRHRDPINHEYKRNFVPAQNTNNGLLLGNTNNNINMRKVLPIQQPVANIRYTLIRKNGVVEHYEDLGVILKKYPQMKLPLNQRQVADSTGINNSLKSSENARTSHLTKPLNNINIPLNQNNNNIAATSVTDRSIILKNQILQNTTQISDSIQDNRYRNMGNPIAKIPVNNSVMLPRRNHGDTLMHLTNQVFNAKADLNNMKEQQTQNNSRSENLSNHVNQVSEKSVTNLHTKNLTSQEKSAITAIETVVNKFENKIENTMDATTLGLKRSSDLETQSYNKLDQNMATIEKNNKLLKQQSASASISNVTESSTAINSLEQEEIHKVITDQENSHEESPTCYLPNESPKCVKSCPRPRTCATRNIDYKCSNNANETCSNECVCDDGFYRNSDGFCVTYNFCDEQFTDPHEEYKADKKGEDIKKCTGPNEEYKADKKTCPLEICPSKLSLIRCACDPNEVGEPGCACKPGFFRLDLNSTCIPKDQCPGQNSTTLKCILPNESSQCVKACPEMRTCENRDKIYHCPNMPVNASCTYKCACNDGYYRNSDGFCVTSELCDNKCTRPNEVYKADKKSCPLELCPSKFAFRYTCNLKEVGKPGCVCKPGFMRISPNSTCIPKEQCPRQDKPTECTLPNESLKCVKSCPRPRTCLNRKIHYKCYDVKNETCRYECVCNDGFYKNSDGFCVTRDLCADKKNCPPQTCESIRALYKCDSKEKGQPGCVCKPGFLRLNPNSTCIPSSECPQNSKTSDSCNGD